MFRPGLEVIDLSKVCIHILHFHANLLGAITSKPWCGLLFIRMFCLDTDELKSRKVGVLAYLPCIPKWLRSKFCRLEVFHVKFIWWFKSVPTWLKYSKTMTWWWLPRLIAFVTQAAPPHPAVAHRQHPLAIRAQGDELQIRPVAMKTTEVQIQFWVQGFHASPDIEWIYFKQCCTKSKCSNKRGQFTAENLS